MVARSSNITLEDVAEVEQGTKFSEPPAYGILTVDKWDNGNSAWGRFSVHKSLTAVKTHISACSKDYSYARRGRKATKEAFVATSFFRVYEFHGAEGWVQVYDIPVGMRFQLEHELWTNGAAPKEKVAAPQDDVDAAIASIMGVGGQQETET